VSDDSSPLHCGISVPSFAWAAAFSDCALVPPSFTPRHYAPFAKCRERRWPGIEANTPARWRPPRGSNAEAPPTRIVVAVAPDAKGVEAGEGRRAS